MLKLKDGDQDGLLAVARQWVEVVGADEDDDLPGAGCAGDQPSVGGTEREGQSHAVSAAVAVVIEAASTSARIATGAMHDPQEVRRRQAEAARRESARREEESAREDATQAAQRVFAPAPSEVPDPEENPVLGRRPPRPDERAAARHLGKVLDRARLRDPVRTRVSSAMPPGRLSGRDAMLGAAQRAMGMPVTARPFRSVVRQRVESPPVAVGVAVDVSGSMGAYTSVIASTAWIFSHGTRTVAGKAATVAFGSSVTPIVAPGQPPAMVTEFAANQGTHRFTEAAQALDGALGLSRPNGARLLVIVSDGHWETRERRGGARVLSRLAAAGVHILWFCLDPESNVLPHTHRVDITSVSDIPAALADVLVAAIRNA
ncbi:VWA domain-containing protein [Streptomyces sp. NPDC002586]